MVSLKDRFLVMNANFICVGKLIGIIFAYGGQQNPKSVVEVACDSPKVNVFCAVSTFKVYGPFFFLEQTVTGIAFLDMLTEWLLPQLNEDSADFILQMDGAQLHFH